MKIKRKSKLVVLFLSLVMAFTMVPTTAFAAEQKTSAITTSRTYNGTIIVDVTDMYFASAVNEADYERLSATAIGKLSSPNAGHYTTLNGLTNLQLKERDPSLYPNDPVDWNEWYSISDGLFDSAVIPTDVTIEKAKPEFLITVSETSVRGGQEIQVTVSLENDFDYEAGLPTAEQIEITATNAALKNGTKLEQNGNQYTALFVLSDETSALKAEFFVNVSAEAMNYQVLAQPISTSVAINNPADYTKVDETIAKAKALKKDHYKDFSVVEATVNAVVRGKNITEQSIVDGYATAIENAMTALEYKDADYSKVDAAIDKIPADLSIYTDTTVKTLNDAKNAVIRGKNITEQAIVDAYVSAIENAINGLMKKADTTLPDTTSPKTTSPKTGDTNNILLWVALLFISGGAVTVLGVSKKCRKVK